MNPDRVHASERAHERADRARLFAALELAAPARDELVGWRKEALRREAGLRPVDPHALHATLCFLGSRPVSEIEAIAAAAQTLASESQVALSLGDALWLPRRRPRVLAVELEDHAQRRALTRLQSKLSTVLAAGGFYTPADRPFLGHVTVARVARSARVRATLPPPAPLRFAATRVTLYRSHLGRPDVRYQPLATIHLRAE